VTRDDAPPPPVASMAQALTTRAGDSRPGVRFEDRTWSWAEVVDQATRRAALWAALRRAGPPHVALLLANTPEHLWWLGAAALSGAVAVGANPTHRGAVLAHDLAHTRCQLLVTDRRHLSLVAGLDLGPGIGVAGAGNPRVIVVDDPATVDQLADVELPPVAEPQAAGRPGSGDPPGPGASALGHLIFTSGTSGAPKACRCTQGRLAFIGAVLAERFHLGPGDCCYLSMPLFHSNALMAGWAPALVSGATIALPTGGRFTASGFLADVRRHGVTYWNYVGRPMSYVLATPLQPDDADNPLRVVFGNEAAPGDIERFARRFGCLVVDNYGSTEGGVSITRTPDTPPGALGPAPPGVLVVDEHGRERPPARFDAAGRLLNPDEAIGEMVSTSGPGGFEGYWDNEEAEQQRLRAGWYWTGDLVYRDDAGFLWFAGRSDDWLRVDGENFAAAPLARLLERHADVVMAAVYAVPDPQVGDQVMAALQLRPGATFDGEAFAAFLAAQPDLGTKWAPRYIRVCDRLPTTATAKIVVRQLRSEGLDTADPVFERHDGTYLPRAAACR